MNDAEDMKPLLLQVMGKLDTLLETQAEHGRELKALAADVTTLKADVATLKADSVALKTGQAVLDARLDEQGRILVALIPTRLAAVPSAA